jgi:UDP-N-acetylmuramoyl-tripeptide--D-alanyl-D-alanine ligase
VSWTLTQLAGWCGGELRGDPATRVSRVATDSRSIEAGDLFVALVGESFDGHAFAAASLEAGAVAALVSEADSLPGDATCIRVADTGAALLALASGHRASFSGPVVAITGSNGKTSTKEICADVLAATGARVLRNRGNLNNHIGLPLTVLELEPDHDVAVVELGMNHPGEIDTIARVARPTVGAITQVALAHLGPMGSLEAIALAKGELLDHIAPEGTAVLNADDPHVMSQAGRFAGTHLCFGFGEDADFRALAVETSNGGNRFQLRTPFGECDVSLPLPGRHQVANSLCAAAAAYATGALGDSPLEALRTSLARARGISGRLTLRDLDSGARLLDDSYKANPNSAEAALAALGEIAKGRKLAVLGDMLELGETEVDLHSALGVSCADHGVDVVVGVGPLSRHIVEAASRAGVPVTQHTADSTAAAEFVPGLIEPGDVVLVTGSHAMHMERVCAKLTGDES